jgi:transmembrane sensor
MTERDQRGSDASEPTDRLAQATDWFVRLRAEDADIEDLTRFRHWVEENPENATAYARVKQSWAAVGDQASTPEIMLGRRDALEDAQRAARGRWDSSRPTWMRPAAVAAVACVLLVVASVVGAWVWWSRANTGVYITGVGERRTLTLADGSVVTLDARSRIQVRYRDRERLIDLDQGQARFDVAKDPARPFRVRAGRETVLALGTQFNVELVADDLLVTLIEGRVAVMPEAASPKAEPVAQIDLTAGEGLKVRQDGRRIRLPKVDIARVTAWQSGKLFFDNEPLASAAERINRYAREQIQVDASAADVTVSGVFNAGDARAFVEAITAYFPVKAEQTPGAALRLSAREP